MFFINQSFCVFRVRHVLFKVSRRIRLDKITRMKTLVNIPHYKYLSNISLYKSNLD